MARVREQGVSLIEVMVAQAVLALGLLGAAGLQVRSLQGTDAARMASQAAFVAQGMLERERSARGVERRDQVEFQRQIEAFAGVSGQGEASGGHVRVSWRDERTGAGVRTLELGAAP